MDQGRRKYDPDLFKQEAAKIREEVKLPPIVKTPPAAIPEPVSPAQVSVIMAEEAVHSERGGLLRSEVATVAPGDRPDIKAVEELPPLSVIDGLSQLSVPKSFGLRRRRRDENLDEEPEEEGEDAEEYDTAMMIKTPVAGGAK